MEKPYVGTELKYALTIKSTGFNMDVDPWTAYVVCGKKQLICKRGEGAVVDNDQWYIKVNTLSLGDGAYYLIAEIDVPDDDFEDGYRHEVLQSDKPICIAKNTIKYNRENAI